MRPFITSFGMICTGATYHLHDRWEGVTAVFAGVFGFPCTFVEFVAASVTSVGMAGAGGGDKLSYVSKAMSTVFTIIVCHRLKLLISQTKKVRHPYRLSPSLRHCQTTQTKRKYFFHACLSMKLPPFGVTNIYSDRGEHQLSWSLFSLFWRFWVTNQLTICHSNYVRNRNFNTNIAIYLATMSLRMLFNTFLTRLQHLSRVPFPFFGQRYE